jgi:hypothetical protein
MSMTIICVGNCESILIMGPTRTCLAHEYSIRFYVVCDSSNFLFFSLKCALLDLKVRIEVIQTTSVHLTSR